MKALWLFGIMSHIAGASLKDKSFMKILVTL